METKMKKTIFILLCVVPNLLSAAAAPKPMQKNNSKSQAEKLTELQKIIAANPAFCVTPKEWKKYNWDHAKIREKTSCGPTAGYFIELLTEEKNVWKKSQKRFKQLLDSQKEPVSQDEFIGTYGSIEDKIIKPLLEEKNAPEHKLFLFSLQKENSNNGHVFVIEKKNTTAFHTSWCIYQSWETFFTAAEWIGANPWQQSEASLTRLYNCFGGCKKLTKEEVFNFLQTIPRFITQEPKTIQCYIKIWDNTAAYLTKNITKQSIANALACWESITQEEEKANKEATLAQDKKPAPAAAKK